MSERIYYTSCPLCFSNRISQVFSVRDYTVSNENFEVWECSACTARFTQQVPAPAYIDAYYQSSNYISHTDTQKGFINRAYHFIRYFTLRSKKRWVERAASYSSHNLMDIGAGIGSFAFMMQQHGWKVMGLEPNNIARENAFKKYHLQLHAPGALFSTEPASLDVITLWHVLEHVHELHEYFSAFHKILKTEGRLFIAVPNYTSYDARYYKQYWAAYDVPRHLYHFSPKSMALLAEKHGFSVQRQQAMWFDSFYVGLLSEQYKTGKMAYWHPFFVALRSNWQAIKHAGKCSSVVYELKKI